MIDLYHEFKASNIAQFGGGIAVKFETFDDKRFGSISLADCRHLWANARLLA